MTHPNQEKASQTLTPQHWFSTPIWIRKLASYERMNTDIVAFVDGQQGTMPSVSRSNVGGWRSHDKIHGMERFSELTGIVGNVCAQCAKHLDFDFGNFDLLITQMWINRNGPGDYNKLHAHPNSLLSGAYYVQMPPQGGNIEFHDPVPVRPMMGFPTRAGGSGTPSSVELKCEEGMLLVFPSWLQHGVQPNRSSDYRISVSFNVAFRAKKRPAAARQKGR